MVDCVSPRPCCVDCDCNSAVEVWTLVDGDCSCVIRIPLLVDGPAMGRVCGDAGGSILGTRYSISGVIMQRIEGSFIVNTMNFESVRIADNSGDVIRLEYGPSGEDVVAVGGCEGFGVWVFDQALSWAFSCRHCTSRN